ncbi:MAG: porin family protein, partial [Pseudomonadota bacterium]|nr:porin family protein [Pseudomonadota bacterium]
MKNILLSAVALVGLTAGALAADLPMRAAPPPA